MAARRSGLGSGLDALIPPKKKRSEDKKQDHSEGSSTQENIAQERKTEPANHAAQTEDSEQEEKAVETKESLKKTSVSETDRSPGSVSAEKKASAKKKTGSSAKNTEKEEKEPGHGQKQKKASNSPSDTSAASNAQKAGKQEFTVAIDRVEPNRNQPRKEFDLESLKELADSISEYGILQPLLVADKGDYYQIIAGERRWRAAKLAGLKEVPVIVRELTDQEIVEISLIENIQREDLNPIEEAQAYRTLIEEFQLKQSDVAKRVSKSRTVITNSMRLLKLDQKVQKMLIDGKLTVGHARALIALEDPMLQIEVAEQTAEKKLSVREVEDLIRSLLNPKKTREKEKTSAELEHLYRDLEEQMKLVLGTKVEIKNKGKQGKIEISYFSQEELDHILLMLKSIDKDI
jgi:ParB family chromosome partitioning protein